jgi:hypothetical protein
MKPFPEPNVCDFSPWTGCAPLHIFWFPRAGVGTQSGRASVPCEQAATLARCDGRVKQP